jgi:hypothetical protein
MPPCSVESLASHTRQRSAAWAPEHVPGLPSQIGTSAPRHDRAYYVGPLGCRYQRCTGSGTGPEVANAKVSSIGMLR